MSGNENKKSEQKLDKDGNDDRVLKNVIKETESGKQDLVREHVQQMDDIKRGLRPSGITDQFGKPLILAEEQHSKSQKDGKESAEGSLSETRGRQKDEMPHDSKRQHPDDLQQSPTAKRQDEVRDVERTQTESTQDSTRRHPDDMQWDPAGRRQDEVWDVERAQTESTQDSTRRHPDDMQWDPTGRRQDEVRDVVRQQQQQDKIQDSTQKPQDSVQEVSHPEQDSTHSKMQKTVWEDQIHATVEVIAQNTTRDTDQTWMQVEMGIRSAFGKPVGELDGYAQRRIAEYLKENHEDMSQLASQMKDVKALADTDRQDQGKQTFAQMNKAIELVFGKPLKDLDGYAQQRIDRYMKEHEDEHGTFDERITLSQLKEIKSLANKDRAKGDDEPLAPKQVDSAQDSKQTTPFETQIHKMVELIAQNTTRDTEQTWRQVEMGISSAFGKPVGELDGYAQRRIAEYLKEYHEDLSQMASQMKDVKALADADRQNHGKQTFEQVSKAIELVFGKPLNKLDECAQQRLDQYIKEHEDEHGVFDERVDLAQLKEIKALAKKDRAKMPERI